MLKNLIVKSDGTEIDSSLILSCTLTQTLNSGQEFTIGSACTDEIEVEYLAQDDNLIAKGDVLTLYWVNDSGTKTKVGIYYGEPLNSATATVTPAAVENFFNIYIAAFVEVPRGCCVTIAVENSSTQAISVSNSNLIVERES